jgi:hypothetical protein
MGGRGREKRKEAATPNTNREKIKEDSLFFYKYT